MKHLLTILKYLIPFLVFSAPLLYVAIYPSFVSAPGTDCLAGCTIGTGFPLPYRFTQIGGMMDFGPAPEQINYQSLTIDFAAVFLTAILLTLFCNKILFPFLKTPIRIVAAITLTALSAYLVWYLFFTKTFTQCVCTDSVCTAIGCESTPFRELMRKSSEIVDPKKDK